MVTNIPPFGKRRLKFSCSSLISVGKENISSDCRRLSPPCLGLASAKLLCPRCCGGRAQHEPAEGMREGGAKDLDCNNLINAVITCTRDKLGSFRGFPADALLLFAKTEAFLHNKKLSQQRWPGQHLIFSLPASISEKGSARACQSLELDTN